MGTVPLHRLHSSRRASNSEGRDSEGRDSEWLGQQIEAFGRRFLQQGTAFRVEADVRMQD